MANLKKKSHVKMRKRDKIDKKNRSSSHQVNIKASMTWFGNTRQISQNQLSNLQHKYKKNITDPYSFIVKSKSLPTSLLLAPQSSNSEFRSLSLLSDPASLKKNNLLSSLRCKTLQDFIKPNGKDPEQKLKEDQEHFKKVEILKEQNCINKFTRLGRSDRIKSKIMGLIDSSDVLLFVLDARNPQGTRLPKYEEMLREKFKKKKIVFILNKADLVPTNILIDWMRILSKTAPTIAFNCGNKKHKFHKDFGVQAVIRILTQIKSAFAEMNKTWISAGVIGYPNVGKSSFINGMKNKKVCSAAPKAGETVTNQYIHLQSGIFLIDSPGIVAPQENDRKIDLVLKGICRNETIDEPEMYVGRILEIIDNSYLKNHYDINEEWKNSDHFLQLLGTRRGKLMKGGIVDVNTISKILINDFCRGRIPWYYKPEGKEIVENK